MDYHVTVNVEIAKDLLIQSLSKLKSSKINEKLREISENKTDWSGKVLNYVKEIIEKKRLGKLYDTVLVPVFTSSKIVTNYQLEKPLNEYADGELSMKIRERINSADDKDSDTSKTDRISLTLDGEKKTWNDIELAQLIILLSELAKNSRKLFCAISFQIGEFPGAIFYVLSDGHIALSERSYNRNKQFATSSVLQSLGFMNAIIDGKREIPEG